MAENSTVARPYASAIFDVAQKASDLAGWSDRLELIAAVVADPTMMALIGSPKAEAGQIAGLINDVCGDKLNAEGQNLVKLLAENDRLTSIADIASRYDELKAEAEKTVEAEVITATPIDDAQQQKLATALQQKLGRSVRLNCSVDEDLMGGAVIRAGDMVIDGSVKTRLQKLAGAITS